jgi:hypothetical protein
MDIIACMKLTARGSFRGLHEATFAIRRENNGIVRYAHSACESPRFYFTLSSPARKSIEHSARSSNRRQ